jgi:GNAT superfamily N-acetyltransferase
VSDAVLAEVRAALRVPFTPQPFARLAAAGGYLDAVWPRVRPSVEAAGFAGSALYMADMALAAVEEVYEPVGRLKTLREPALEAVIDLFHYTQPQMLLVLAALAEAWDRDEVGGHGRAELRTLTDRERRHLATDVRLAASDSDLLPEITAALALEEPSDLYRAVAEWPRYLEAAWEELQHLVAYPEFRRRGRGLYYYARSGARFLAQPLVANPEALREAGLTEAALTEAKAALDAALPTLATMMMHVEAMRLGLGIAGREVVQT